MKQLLRLLKYILPYKINIVAIFICNILYAIFSVFSLTLIAPFLSVLFGHVDAVTTKPALTLDAQSVIDTFYYYMGAIIQSHGTFSALVFIALTMIVFSFLSNLFRYLGHFFDVPIRTGIVQSLRRDIYHRLLILPLSYYSQQRKGDILNRVGVDVQEVEWSVICSLRMIIRDPVLVLVFLITLFSINYKLTLFALVILPITGFLTAQIGKGIKKNSVEAQSILGKMSAAFDEAISGLRIIKGYNARHYMQERFEQLDERFFVLNRRIFRKTELGTPLVEFLCISTLVIILLAGFLFMGDPSALAGESLIMFVVVFARIIPPAKAIVTAYYTVQKGMAAAERIFEVIDADEVIEEQPRAIEKRTFEEKICYDRVSFRYHKAAVDALSDISFQLKKSKSVAIVGSSGSGKSTLVDLLPRFYDVCSGQITIDGVDIRDMKISQLRSLFGIVNQDVILFNDTVYNNIAFGKVDATRAEIEAAARAAFAHDFIMEMEAGYDTPLGDGGARLSGGQRQRISIARAILQNPQILILDEATSALDNEAEQIVQASLQQLMQGRTTIVIAHRLSTIRNCDHILFMAAGKIVEQGTHETLMQQQGEYYKFYTLQEIKS